MLSDVYDAYDTHRHSLNQKLNENFIIQLQQTTPTQASYTSYTSYSRNDNCSNNTAFTDITAKDTSLLYSCYYCDNFETNIEIDYQRHGILKHSGKPCYPSKADLELLGIQGQGKAWER